jgi:hypothetical protein
MKTAIMALAAATMLGATTPATAEDLHKDGMTGPEVAAWLQKAGYKAELTKDESGDPLITSAAEGQSFKIYFYDCDDAKRCKALQFSAGFDLKTPLTLDKANEWNRKNRYLKAYLDDDGDPYVQYDVNVNAGRTLAGLDDDFGVWTGMIDDFTAFIGW